MMDLRFAICDLQLGAATQRPRSLVFQSQTANRKSQIRSGFSFPEVLFAVAVLGIGFIMVAAIFPVAIIQTQAAMEETRGTTVVRNGVYLISASPRIRKDIAGTPPTVFVPPTPNPVAATPAGTPSPVVYSFRDPRVAAAQEARAASCGIDRGD